MLDTIFHVIIIWCLWDIYDKLDAWEDCEDCETADELAKLRNEVWDLRRDLNR